MAAAGSSFLKVFSKRINKAAVKTDKAEEKLLDEDQYVPAPGHIALLKGLHHTDGAGRAMFVSLGGSRMEEVRTWGHANEMYSRNLTWSDTFDVGNLSRLNSFQVTTASGRTSQGSVTIPLHSAAFVDFQSETSRDFEILVVHGQNLETFTTNDNW